MLGRQLNRRRAKDRIDPRSENRNRRACRTKSLVIDRVVEFEIDQRAFAATDPVALHGANFFRPALKLVEIAQQFFCILRDAQKPLLQVALLNQTYLHGASNSH